MLCSWCLFVSNVIPLAHSSGSQCTKVSLLGRLGSATLVARRCSRGWEGTEKTSRPVCTPTSLWVSHLFTSLVVGTFYRVSFLILPSLQHPLPSSHIHYAKSPVGEASSYKISQPTKDTTVWLPTFNELSSQAFSQNGRRSFLYHWHWKLYLKERNRLVAEPSAW